MKKRVFSILLAALLALLPIVSVSAADAAPGLSVDGEAYTFEEGQGMIYSESNQRLLISADAAKDVFGCGVDWNSETNKITLSGEALNVVFTVGRAYAKIELGDSTSYMYMDCAPEVHDGVAYVPVRHAAVALGFHVGWDKASKTVAVTAAETAEHEVQIFFTRHGKTMFNTAGRCQGWCDTPLTDAGAQVAANLGKGLKASDVRFVAAYSSDLGRQRQTAHIVLDNMGQSDLPVKEVFGFRETCYGSWEGELESVRDEVFCELAGVDSIMDIYMAGGDLLASLYVQTDTTGMAEDLPTQRARIIGALTQVAQETEAMGGGNVLVVSSGGIGGVLIELFSGRGAELKNASVTRISYRDGVFFMHTIGDLSYSQLGETIE